MTGQGSSSYESIIAGKTKVTFLNLSKSFKTECGYQVRALVFKSKDGLRVSDIDGNQIIKGQYILEGYDDEKGLVKDWKETEWSVTGVHPTNSQLNLVERKPVTPRLRKLFDGL